MLLFNFLIGVIWNENCEYASGSTLFYSSPNLFPKYNDRDREFRVDSTMTIQNQNMQEFCLMYPNKNF